MKKVIRSDKPVTFLLLFWSHKCGFGVEPRSGIIATSAVKGLKGLQPFLNPVASSDLGKVFQFTFIGF
jgi:hypothetical protein